MTPPGVRVIAGSARGRRLAVPAGDVVRPTKDRVKAAVFSALDARDLVRDAVVLDLFAGCGSLAIEALSRGAASATFVERSPLALAALRDNVARCGFAEQCRVVSGDVTRFVNDAAQLRGTRAGSSSYDLAFVDPPYGMSELELESPLSLVASALVPGGTIVIERPSPKRARRFAVAPSAEGSPGGDAGELTVPSEWSRSWERTFGDTLVVFWTPSGSSDESRVAHTKPTAERGDD